MFVFLEEAFDAGDFLNFDLEMSKPKSEPPKKKGESVTRVCLYWREFRSTFLW